MSDKPSEDDLAPGDKEPLTSIARNALSKVSPTAADQFDAVVDRFGAEEVENALQVGISAGVESAAGGGESPQEPAADQYDYTPFTTNILVDDDDHVYGLRLIVDATPTSVDVFRSRDGKQVLIRSMEGEVRLDLPIEPHDIIPESDPDDTLAEYTIYPPGGRQRAHELRTADDYDSADENGDDE